MTFMQFGIKWLKKLEGTDTEVDIDENKQVDLVTAMLNVSQNLGFFAYL